MNDYLFCSRRSLSKLISAQLPTKLDRFLTKELYSWRTERPSLQLPRHCNRPQLDHLFGPVRPGFKSVMNERTISPRARRPFNNLFKFLSLHFFLTTSHKHTKCVFSAVGEGAEQECLQLFQGIISLTLSHTFSRFA